MEELSESQTKLVNIVKQIGRRGEDSIEAGPSTADVFGRNLRLESQAVNGTSLNQETQDLIEKIKLNDGDIETILRGEVMWYDVRSSVWFENPMLAALFALAYASVLIERTGKKTGHTLNIAIDCYPKHFDSMSIFVDTILRTGICQDSGGIIYWGVQNGGAIRNVSQYERAITSEGGNWVYGTMSHRPEDYVGAKMGMQGKVFCGPDLRDDLYGRLVSGNYPEFVEIANPKDYVITVGDITRNNSDVVEDLIRARTGTEVQREELLLGLKVGLNMCGSPVGKNLEDILRAFGADVIAENEALNPDFSTANIVDPNEHESAAMKSLCKKAEKDERIWLAVDPDGDRGTVIAKNNAGEAVSLTGTELLLLSMENLATYNPDKIPSDIIYDMRTGVSVYLLFEALKKKGFSLNIIASEPGYPFFMELMGENKNAVMAFENTCHPFMTPFTNPIWGAKQYFEGVQGGDDAAILLVYLLALSNLAWGKRNPIQQLEHIQNVYGIPKTIIKEFKPAVDKRDALRKYDIAEAMCKIAVDKLRPCGYLVDTMNSGVRVTAKDNNAMVLVRYSNTGPSFTASGEAIDQEGSEAMFKLGAAIMNLAITKVRKEKGDFAFDWLDFSAYGNTSEEEATEIINQACL